MITINNGSDHPHRWRALGAHSLHAGSALNTHPIVKKDHHREVRTVFVCTRAGCRALRVKISRFDAWGKGEASTSKPLRRQRFRTGGFRTHIETSAALCRRMGWKIGTILESTDSDGVAQRIQITAFGESAILVRDVRPDFSRGVEVGFDLTRREWKEAPHHLRRFIPHHTGRDVVAEPPR